MTFYYIKLRFDSVYDFQVRVWSTKDQRCNSNFNVCFLNGSFHGTLNVENMKKPMRLELTEVAEAIQYRQFKFRHSTTVKPYVLNM